MIASEMGEGRIVGCGGMDAIYLLQVDVSKE